MFRLPIDTRTTPHLGLAYLGAVSERRGDEVRIYDADVEEQPLADFLREFRPHLVGITANTPQVKQAWRTAAAIKAGAGHPGCAGRPARQRGRRRTWTSSRCASPASTWWCAARAKAPGSRSATGWRPSCATSRPSARPRLMDPALDLFGDVLGPQLQDRRWPVAPQRGCAGRSPTWTACPGRPITCSRWSATPTCSRPPMPSMARAASRS